MNKKLLIGIIVVIVGGLVVVTAMSRPLYLGVPLSALWIYLVFMVWKKKTQIFHDQMEPRIAERHLQWLKTSLLVAGISLAVFVGMSLYFRIFGLPEWPEAVGFFIGAISIWMFIVATIGGLAIFLKGRRKETQRDIATSKI
jgi:hypothetical protein